MKETKQAYPLCWPEGWARTKSGDHRNLNSRMNLARAAGTVWAEVRAIGGKDLILSTNMPLRNDGLPYGSGFAEPQDRGAAAYFNYKGKPFVMACDRFFYLAQNVRAIALSIEAIRALERYGASELMERAFKGFTALPERASEAWRDVLEIPPEAKPSEEQIERAFRSFAHIYHPDKGGTADEFQRLCLARENAKRDMGYAR